MSGIEMRVTSVDAAFEGPTGPRSLRAIRVWGPALAAGLIAGLGSWLIGEAFHGRFVSTRSETGARPDKTMQARSVVEAWTSATREASAAFGAVGASLGLALGLAGGVARRSARSALIAGPFGAVLGGAAGVGMARVLLPPYFRAYDPDHGDLTLAVLIQGGIWPAVGAAGGAALGIGLAERGRAIGAIVGGLMGAVIGLLVYEFAGAVLFPLEATANPLSATARTRLFARLALCLFGAAGAAMGALSPAKRAYWPGL